MRVRTSPRFQQRSTDSHRLRQSEPWLQSSGSIAHSELGETGEYDPEGLFIRIADAVQRVGARRVVLDTIEALFGDLPIQLSCAPKSADSSTGSG
jgi:hypothetical protein